MKYIYNYLTIILAILILAIPTVLLKYPLGDEGHAFILGVVISACIYYCMDKSTWLNGNTRINN